MVATLIDINPRTPLSEQFKEKPEAGPCVLVNTFHIPADKMEEALAAWKIDAELARKQPGFISTQLHRGVNGSDMMFNYAILESTAALKAYYDLPEFKETLVNYPDGTEARIALYRKQHIDGICLV